MSSGEISAHTLNPGGQPALRLSTDVEMIPEPGQPLLAYLPGSAAELRTALYPSKIHADGFTSVKIPSPDWAIGIQVDLLGPLGRGFSPPPSSRRWLLMVLDRPIDRLLPLIDTALSRDVSIVVWGDGELPDLPAPVEIATSLADVVRWADYLALDIPFTKRGKAKHLLGMEDGITVKPSIEVLFDLQFACGLGVCSVCAMLEGNAWKFACLDGPVFHADRWIW